MSDFTESKNIGLGRIRDEMRIRYNPLNDLTPQKITRAMDAFRCGYLSDAAKIYDAIRRRDGIVQACVQKRKRATSRLEWTIVEMGDDDAASAEQSKFLEDFYNNIRVTSAADANQHGSMSMLIKHLLSALENQYAVSEVIWDTSKAPQLSAEVRAVPLWFFENTEGILRFKRSSFATEGKPLEPGGWMVSVNDAPLMEATAVCYIIKRFAMGDWSVFSERFGSATPVLNTDAKRGTDDWNAAVDAVANIANGLGIVLSKGDVFDLKQANGQGEPFPALVDKMERIIALIWRGADLSTLSAGNATGASMQAEESEILEDDDCALVEETLAHYLSVPALKWRFGEDVNPAAYLQLTRKSRKDKLNQLSVFKGAAEIGCPPAKRDVYEALELREPEAGEAVAELQAAAMPGMEAEPAQAFANSLPESDLERLAEARGEDIAPLIEALEKISAESNSPDEYADRLAKLEAKVLDYFNGGKNEAAAWEEIFRKVLNGK